MGEREFKIYKNIATLLISVLTAFIIFVGIAINTNKNIHSIFFETRVVNNKIIIKLINNGRIIEYQYFDVLPLTALILIFILGRIFFVKKGQYEKERGIKQDVLSQKRRNKIFHKIAIFSLMFLAILIVWSLRRGRNVDIVE